ncbi:MAG: hypothetical protein ABWY11_06550, partial [Umezawaea sp.]
DRAETDRLLAPRRPVAQGSEYGFLLGLTLLVPVAAWAAVPAIPGGWLVVTVFVGLLVLWFVTQTRMQVYAPSDETPEEDEARGVRAGRTIWNLLSVTALAFALAWLAWRLVWNAWHWQPLAGAVLAALILWGTLAQVRSWRRSSERSAQSTSDGPPIR